MSIRYSGDTEIRLGFDRRRKVYRGTVVDPYLRYNGEVTAGRGDPSRPEAYDDAARRLCSKAQAWAESRGKNFMLEKKRRRLEIRRVFQSPCPLEDL